MDQLVNSYIEKGLVSDKLWYLKYSCGDCKEYFGEECHGKFEGQERYEGSQACDEFNEEF